MIPAEQLELITAAVDEELSPSELRAFRTLMTTSPEARAAYFKLKADSDRVRALRIAPPPGLCARIQQRISETVTVPAPVPTASRSLGLMKWVPVAIAASLFLSITLGSFVYFSNQASPARQSGAKNPWSNALPATADPVTVVQSPTDSPHTPNGSGGVTPPREDVVPVPSIPLPKEVPPGTVAVAPDPRSVQPDLLGSRVLPPLRPFDFVEARIPFLRPVSELGQDDIRQELIDNLTRDAVSRFDLFVRDTAHGVEVVQNAAKSAGVTLFADATTVDRVKKKQATAIVIYTETLTAAELADLFARVSAEDAKFTPRACDSLHVAPIARFDELDLKATLGFDPGLFKRPRQNGAGGATPPHKPVSTNTIDSVVKAVTDAGEKSAVMLTWQPHSSRTNPAMSAELKQFHAKRGDRKANALPAVIVIRPVM